MWSWKHLFSFSELCCFINKVNHLIWNITSFQIIIDKLWKRKQCMFRDFLHFTQSLPFKCSKPEEMSFLPSMCQSSLNLSSVASPIVWFAVEVFETLFCLPEFMNAFVWCQPYVHTCHCCYLCLPTCLYDYLKRSDLANDKVTFHLLSCIWSPCLDWWSCVAYPDHSESTEWLLEYWWFLGNNMGPSIFLILPTPRYLDDEWTFIPTCRVNSHGGFQSYTSWILKILCVIWHIIECIIPCGMC